MRGAGMRLFFMKDLPARVEETGTMRQEHRDRSHGYGGPSPESRSRPRGAYRKPACSEPNR
jgi:hypothetical protein